MTALLSILLHRDIKSNQRLPEEQIHDCRYGWFYSRPDCDTGWNPYQNHYYFGYELYMFPASDSENNLPVFPFMNRSPDTIPHEFLYAWYSMKQFPPNAVAKKLFLESAWLCLCFLPLYGLYLRPSDISLHLYRIIIHALCQYHIKDPDHFTCDRHYRLHLFQGILPMCPIILMDRLKLRIPPNQ